MTLPATGQIAVSQVNTELNVSADAAFSLGDQYSRALANQRSGQFSFDKYHGKTMGINLLTAGTLSGSHGYFKSNFGAIDPLTIAGSEVLSYYDSASSNFLFETARTNPKSFYNATRVFGGQGIDKTLWFEDAIIPSGSTTQLYWNGLFGMLAPNSYFVYTYY